MSVYDDESQAGQYVANDDGVDDVTRQGSMWQARERLFSRWKERFFTLTRYEIS